MSRFPRVPGHAPALSWLDFAPARAAEDDVPPEIRGGYPRGDWYSPEAGRAGFEAGGPADVMTPCPVLSSLTGQAAGRMSELTDDELVGVMRAARRVQSWQAAVELEAVHQLVSRRLAQPQRVGPRPGERASAEIAAALTLTGQAADDWMFLAAGVDRLDAVREGLTSGRIDLARAKAFVEELAQLDTLLANCLATSVLLGAGTLTANQLRGRLRRAVLAADPDAVRRRQAAGQRQARIEIWGEPSGNAVLAGRELPPAGALAASRHLTALARALRKAGAPGDLDQIRARVYLALLSGRDPATVLHPETPAEAGGEQTEPARASGPQPQPSPPASPRTGAPGTAEAAGPDAAGPDAAGTGVPSTADATGPDAPGSAEATSAGAPGSGASGSAEAAGPDAPGTGTADAAGPRQPAYGGTGIAGRQSQPGAGEPAAGPALQWPAGLRGSIHLTLPLSAFLGHSDRPGQVTGYGPADAWTCRYLARQLAGQPGTRYCLTLTTDDGHPVGHACTSVPPPAKGPPPPGTPPPASSPPPPGQAGPAPPVPDPVRDWLGQLHINWIDRQPGCDHAQRTAGYRPGKLLAHLVKVVNPTCTAPGCRRPASQSDLDHIQPYDQGGLTCTCNLQTACRHHHQLKQLPRWHVTMTRPGQLTWTLPHGRSYTTTAEPYPV